MLQGLLVMIGWLEQHCARIVDKAGAEHRGAATIGGFLGGFSPERSQEHLERFHFAYFHRYGRPVAGHCVASDHMRCWNGDRSPLLLGGPSEIQRCYGRGTGVLQYLFRLLGGLRGSHLVNKAKLP